MSKKEKYEEIIKEAEKIFQQTKMKDNNFSSFTNPFVNTTEKMEKEIRISTGLTYNTL